MVAPCNFESEKAEKGGSPETQHHTRNVGNKHKAIEDAPDKSLTPIRGVAQSKIHRSDV